MSGRGGGLILAAALVGFKTKLVPAFKTFQAASQLGDMRELLTKFDRVKVVKKFGLALTVCYFL